MSDTRHTFNLKCRCYIEMHSTTLASKLEIYTPKAEQNGKHWLTRTESPNECFNSNT